MSDWFQVCTGIRQGAPVIPILFNVVLEYAVRLKQRNEKGVTLIHRIQLLAYVDDIAKYVAAKWVFKLRCIRRQVWGKFRQDKVCSHREGSVVTGSWWVHRSEQYYTFEKISSILFQSCLVRVIREEIKKRLHSESVHSFPFKKLIGSCLPTREVKLKYIKQSSYWL